jgi:hypothetical protein
MCEALGLVLNTANKQKRNKIEKQSKMEFKERTLFVFTSRKTQLKI